MKWQQKYTKHQEIGHGASGTIFKIQNKVTKEIFAAKIINTTQQTNNLNQIEQQIKIMSSCKHPNILNCFGVQLYDSQVWILLEYCEGGSLTDCMNRKKKTFAEEQVHSLTRQVLEGLSYLHKQGIVHRDIKASNLLVKNGVIKIADFGISFYQSKRPKDQKYTKIGSPFWMSPQSIKDSFYSSKSDIWALGITIIQLVQGQPPYSHQHPFRAIYSIQTHPPQGLKESKFWSKKFINFVKQCLNLDVKQRPSAQELLTHSFLTSAKETFPSLQSSPTHSQNSNQNTLIMHQELPKSIWQRNSVPQSQEKYNQGSDTVIIKDCSNDNSFYCDLKQIQSNSNLLSSLKMSTDKKYKMSRDQRQIKARQLLLDMEYQIKAVRQKYMEKVRQLYCSQALKENNGQINPFSSQKQLFKKGIKMKQSRFLTSELYQQ